MKPHHFYQKIKKKVKKNIKLPKVPMLSPNLVAQSKSDLKKIKSKYDAAKNQKQKIKAL